MVKKEQPVKKKTTLTSYNIDSGDCIRVGDSVIIRPCKKRAGSRKGRVEGFREDPRNGVQAMIKHYFDPEDAKHGRRSFHGKREVFLSDMTNEVHGDSIECRINLYYLDEYLQLQCADDELEHTDYFYRLYYDYEKRTFKTVSLMGEVTENGELRVYCKCFMPENPDEFWIPCNGCEDWFHPRCIGTTRKEAETPGYKGIQGMPEESCCWQVTDGCYEYIRDDSKPNGMYCEACAFHRNFHHKVWYRKNVKVIK
ncbi:hypothetical protein IFM89_010895 [Coptis chinensis]|uniref:BAH domain-containing protein n=1 Tax=Coptis chinensis TaxID=261450 RepID=A0A835I2E5_9MAGN|nr:hypothetical protein IFM89_010895 [Coptis chinensis]